MFFYICIGMFAGEMWLYLGSVCVYMFGSVCVGVCVYFYVLLRGCGCASAGRLYQHIIWSRTGSRTKTLPGLEGKYLER